MRLKIALTALVLIAAACGGDDAEPVETSVAAETSAPTTAAPTTEAPTTAAPETTQPASPTASVVLAESGLGEILVDGDGNALYLFVPDAQGASACYDGCAEAWPPLIGDVTAGDGVDAGLLGSVARDDGTEQATFNGWPLYYFASDAAPGDTNGQGVNEVWYVLNASGDAIL